MMGPPYTIPCSLPAILELMSGKELANRGDDPYPNDIKAEAVALVYESGNFSEAAKEMKERYPERAPSRQLITRWFSQVDAEAFASLGVERKEAFQVGIMEVASKAIEKMFDALDDVKPGQLPIAAGIAMDKGLRLLEAERGGTFNANAKNIQINFVTQSDPRLEDPDTVDGEIVKDGDGPSS